MSTETTVSPLSRQEGKYATTLLVECRTAHISGLIELMRFGIAPGKRVREGSVVAAWLFNAARCRGLPQTTSYSRRDGSGFEHCDPEWLEANAKDQSRASAWARDPALNAVLSAAAAIGAGVRLEALSALFPDALGKRLAALLQQRTASALYVNTGRRAFFALTLAWNRTRERLFCCEIEAGRARLKWAPLSSLLKGANDFGATAALISVELDRDSPASKTEKSYRGADVTYLDSETGSRMLLESEGMEIVAYAALHGHVQRDLSSCQVASLASVVLPKGARAKVAEKAAFHSGEVAASSDAQSLLRAVASKRLKEERGVDFDFRGLSVEELRQLAQSVGLTANATTLFERAGDDRAVVDTFRTAARSALGATIVNFARPALDQRVGGHHAVVVAYHPATDHFLIDDPAGFKTPAFWVSTTKLVTAMATFDDTPGVERFRGYVVVTPPGSTSVDDREMSNSIVLHRAK